ncbi:methyl-accepting chemotaxis protein [Ruminococcaceae bacterium OttesenSCG-928-L11]|nr:methyl-accepting chemotaxis protein [Ruminococcaceae bacterium OttesenSCG-928-L11]
MRHLKTKILLAICLLVFIPTITLGLIAINLNRLTTEETLSQTMTQLAQIAGERVEQELNVYRAIAVETGKIARLTSPDSSVEDKRQILEEKAGNYRFNNSMILDASGASIFSGTSYADRAYFEAGMQGSSYISEPVIDPNTGEIRIVLAAPLWRDGKQDSTVDGVIVFEIPGSILIDIVSNIKISPGAAAQIIDRNGTMVAHPDAGRVKAAHNSIELAKSNPALAAIAELETLQTQGKTGFGTYTMEGVEKFLAYAPVPNTNGWSIGVNAPTADFMETYYLSVYATIAAVALFLVLSSVVAIVIAGRISRPVSQCATRLSQLAKGDLHKPVPTTTARDETGVLLDSLNDCVVGLRTMIDDISGHLGEMAHGNLAIRIEQEYSGDFASIRESLDLILHSFQSTLREISGAATQVDSASDQIAAASQMLAQSATEQSQGTEELGNAVSVITQQTQDTAEFVSKASQLGNEMGDAAENASRQMAEMIVAIREIQKASNAIESVIKEIDDIASQTNLLSLNAAVEAARAGESGKGFAVVADEVRNLALKSAQAAKDTTALITDTIVKSEKGCQISQATSDTMTVIIQGIHNTTATLDTILANANTQAREADKINVAISEEIKVVQQNSATSQQTAAASEEMSAQARHLLHMVSKFKLEDANALPKPLDWGNVTGMSSDPA